MKKADWHYLIANILKFYEGSISYDNIFRMSFEEILMWERYAQKINNEIEKEVKK